MDFRCYIMVILSLVLVSGCVQYTDSSRSYYVIENDCAGAALEVMKGDDAAAQTSEDTTDIDAGYVPK